MHRHTADMPTRPTLYYSEAIDTDGSFLLQQVIPDMMLETGELMGNLAAALLYWLQPLEHSQSLMIHTRVIGQCLAGLSLWNQPYIN